VDFRSYATRPDGELTLLEGAVLIARLGHPTVDPAEEAARLDELARPLKELELGRRPLAVQARAMADHLYISNGFRGNVESYHDPDNSFINRVLERRLGIPISLAVVYLEVARRVGIVAHGVGFPGHFLVRLDDESGSSLVIDPFFGGEILDRAALESLLKRGAPRGTLVDEMLDRVAVRQIVTRMLINLKSIYAARGEAGHLLAVLDHLADLIPEAVDEVRDRGFLCARLGAPRQAVADLKSYVEALPHAGDAAEIRRVIARLEAGLANAN
jgi:regulator of sirC expression with transglutaminase-like and TPR domain